MAEPEYILEVVVEEFELLEVAEKGDPGTGSGDMTKAVYDPTAVAGDAFDMGNMAESVTAKVLTGVERTKLSGVEPLAEVNNISDVNATALTDGGETALHSHAGGGGGGGEWEDFTNGIKTLTGGESEILWTGLDFGTYEYRITGCLVFNTGFSNFMRWWSVEADSANDVPANYASSGATLKIGSTIAVSQSASNNFAFYHSADNGASHPTEAHYKDVRLRVINGRLSLSSTGTIILGANGVSIHLLGTQSTDTVTSSLSNKFGLFRNSGTFGASVITMQRKAL